MWLPKVPVSRMAVDGINMYFQEMILTHYFRVAGEAGERENERKVIRELGVIYGCL